MMRYFRFGSLGWFILHLAVIVLILWLGSVIKFV